MIHKKDENSMKYILENIFTYYSDIIGQLADQSQGKYLGDHCHNPGRVYEVIARKEQEA